MSDTDEKPPRLPHLVFGGELKSLRGHCIAGMRTCDQRYNSADAPLPAWQIAGKRRGSTREEAVSLNVPMSHPGEC